MLFAAHFAAVGADAGHSALQPPRDALREAWAVALHDRKEGADCEDPGEGELEFIHIPKTAGTTVEALGLQRGVCWGQYNHKLNDVTRPLGCPKWHTPSRFFADRDDGKTYSDPFKNSTTFCIKRHPFTRVISQFLMEQGLQMPPCSKCDPKGLNEWVHQKFNPSNDETFVKVCSPLAHVAAQQFAPGHGRGGGTGRCCPVHPGRGAAWAVDRRGE